MTKSQVELFFLKEFYDVNPKNDFLGKKEV